MEQLWKSIHPSILVTGIAHCHVYNSMPKNILERNLNICSMKTSGMSASIRFVLRQRQKRGKSSLTSEQMAHDDNIDDGGIWTARISSQGETLVLGARLAVLFLSLKKGATHRRL